MIDYEKLRIAHELAFELGRTTTEFIDVSVQFNLYTPEHPCDYKFGTSGRDFDNIFSSIDDLIKKLQELTKPALKYKNQQQVYWLYGGRPCTGKITSVSITGRDYRYEVKENGELLLLHEDELYPSSEALIDAQIAFWSKMKSEVSFLKNEEKSTGFDDVSMECEHERTFLSGFRCVKCGENFMQTQNPNGDCIGVSQEEL